MGDPAIGRRAVLFSLLAGALAAPAHAFSRGEHRTLSLYNNASKERFEGAYWSNGRYVPSALTQLSQFWRDCHDHRSCRLDPRLLDLVHDMQASLGGAEITVICGYRSPASNAKARRQRRGVARQSYHLRGQAVDIRVPEFRLKDLRQVALGLERGGVGVYSRANYLHLDTGPVRHWGR